MRILKTFKGGVGQLADQERLLASQIQQLSGEPLHDQLALQRLKRLQRQVLSEIDRFKNSALPDIIA